MGKRLALFLMIGVMVLGALAACGGSTTTEPSSSSSSAPAGSSTAPASSESAAPAGSTSTAPASSGAATGGAPVTEVEIDSTEMEFSPAAITAPANSTLTVTFKNSGAVLHDFTIDKDGSGKKVVAKADPGKSQTVKVATGAAGSTLEFYCSQPGHKDAGMDGHITVQ